MGYWLTLPHLSIPYGGKSWQEPKRVEAQRQELKQTLVGSAAHWPCGLLFTQLFIPPRTPAQDSVAHSRLGRVNQSLVDTVLQTCLRQTYQRTFPLTRLFQLCQVDKKQTSTSQTPEAEDDRLTPLWPTYYSKFLKVHLKVTCKVIFR